MKQWSPEATRHLEMWLGRVRHALPADPTVNADEVAQELRAHVHAELAHGPDPVTPDAVELVLARIGHPADWSDGAAQTAARTPWHRRSVTDVAREWQRRLGGEWGLPVLLSILTMTGALTFADGGFVLMIVAYVIARASLVHGPTDRGRERWLLIAPVAAGNGLLAGGFFGFPLIVFRPNHVFDTFVVLGVWLVAAGLATAREPRHVRRAMHPLVPDFDAAHGRAIALLGGAFLMAGLMVAMLR